ncbi:MAG: hypothetical protein ACLPIX_13210 [Rhodomicrobium sp.]
MVIVDEIEAQSIMARRLRLGETLVWFGVPKPWRAARNYLGVLAFMTIWTGLAVRSLAVKASQLGSLKLGVFMASLFSLLGAAVWLWTAKKAAYCWRTAYGLTNRRVIIAAGLNGPTQSYSPAKLSGFVRSGGESEGSILFDFGPLGEGSSGYRAGLHGIRDPGRVEALIYETLLGNKKGAA